MSIERIAKKMEQGETLKESEWTEVYNAFPEILERLECYGLALRSIASGRLTKGGAEHLAKRFTGGEEE